MGRRRGGGGRRRENEEEEEGLELGEGKYQANSALFSFAFLSEFYL